MLERYRGRDSLLSPTDAHRLLGLFGIAAVEPIPVRGRDGLALAAARAGFPLVLKAASPAIVHKTESEAVVLGLRDLGELEAAYDRMSGRWPCEETRFFVQRQVEGGREVIMGAKANRGLTPTIAFGLGGIWVEALKDVRFKLAPLSPEEAADMIRSIQGFPVLAGLRGSDPVDLAALEDMLVRVAGMAATIPEIREIDLNPVMALGEGLGALVVDARIRVRSASAV